MNTKLILSRKLLEKAQVCQDGFDMFDNIAGDDSIIILDWTPLHELMVQAINPIVITWLKAKKIIPKANFSGMNLSGLDLSNADFKGADLSHCDLTDANLSGAHMEKANLMHSNIDGANFNSTHLEKALRHQLPPSGWIVKQGLLHKEDNG